MKRRGFLGFVGAALAGSAAAKMKEIEPRSEKEKVSKKNAFSGHQREPTARLSRNPVLGDEFLAGNEESLVCFEKKRSH